MRRLLLFIVPLAAIGCGQSPDPAESTASKQAGSEAAAQWSPEMKQKFKDAMKGHQLTAGANKEIGSKK